MTRDKILNQAAENAKKVQKFSPKVRELLDRQLDWDDSDEQKTQSESNSDNGVQFI